MSQSLLLIDFPIEAPAAKALPEVLPPLMPELAKAQDHLGTVHFSRFMVQGEEKLLLLSDIDGDVGPHIERLVETAAPVFDAVFEHVHDAPATPVAGNAQGVSKWLKHHVREPLDSYSAYEDASVQDIKAAASAAGFTGATEQHTLLTYMTIKSRLQAFEMKRAGKSLKDEGKEASDSLGTLHFSHWVPFEHNHLGFFTIFDGDFAKYIQDFADKTGFFFDAVFPHIVGGPPTPVEKNAQGFYEWALEANHPPIGFYSAYPGLGVQDVRALLADHRTPGTAD